MKKVLYTQRVEVIDAYNERRDCVDQRIPEYIFACGYLPISVPNNWEIVEQIVDNVDPDGIVLVGGNSLVKYGGDAPERDDTDRKLIDLSVKRQIPLYGFCRGMQSILDYFGNNLVKVDGHVAKYHTITGIEDSIEVNSYHNEACLKLDGNELVAVMRADDGVIEKIRHKSLPIIGTMWHPEREKSFRKNDINLLKTLIGGFEK
ncbi:hypothetical protein FZ041_03320 [Selenomonas caprae]|uniref:Glutamine amidotransferase domain-containing protein n=2 Tax=Selenomonas caprae TaxID=2606905 RepID=A0A5D6WQF9_9FIRM|nr:hypothetical protein FZ041_03320 [Selenomonas caprae]